MARERRVYYYMQYPCVSVDADGWSVVFVVGPSTKECGMLSIE